jgi:hypothetical protein
MLKGMSCFRYTVYGQPLSATRLKSKLRTCLCRYQIRKTSTKILSQGNLRCRSISCPYLDVHHCMGESRRKNLHLLLQALRASRLASEVSAPVYHFSAMKPQRHFRNATTSQSNISQSETRALWCVAVAEFAVA